MIAREGLPLILIALTITVVLVLMASRWDSRTLIAIAALSAVLCVYTTFFFRDPNRSFDQQPGALIAPADGRILGVEKVMHHEYIGGEALKVSIFLSIFDVHVNRIPVDGTVEFVNYNPGKFFKAFLDKASDENEQTEIGIATASGQRLVVKQIAGMIARRIVCHLKPNDDVSAGARFGLIRFGSRAELFVPADTEILVKKGEHVKGGATVIGTLAANLGKPDKNDSTQAENVEL